MFDTVIRRLERLHPAGQRIFLGFDGFVDEIVHVVDKRLDADHFVRLDSLREYGSRMASCSGLSTNVEMVTIQQKLGGNGPILANALIHHGFDVTYMGAVGKNSVHPVFQDMAARCRVLPLSDPGFTDAIEFFDGKIISSKLSPLNDVSWRSIVDRLGARALAALMDASDLVGFENWTMLLHMNDIWAHMCSDILPMLTSERRQKLLFIDLADPEKRTEADLRRALELLEKFHGFFRVIMGFNKKEACEIARLLGRAIDRIEAVETLELTAYLQENLPADTVVVHPVAEACAASEEGVYRVDGPYCSHPKLTTGAGDNFNAGFLLGQLSACPLDESLLLGTASSGYYVRNEKSATLADLCQFLRIWRDGGLA